MNYMNACRKEGGKWQESCSITHRWLQRLDAMLNMDERSLGPELSADNAEGKSSVLADLKNRSEQLSPEKRFNEEVSL